MRAQEIRGDYAEWRTFVNGPHDYAALLDVRGIGPARAALLLRVFGSIDHFLAADCDEVATRTHGLIGPQRARALQGWCREAGLRSDWSRLEKLAAEDDEAVARLSRRWRLRELRRAGSALFQWARRWQEVLVADGQSLVRRHADQTARTADQEIG